MKVTAIIPTLNPSNQILNVISSLLENGFESIIVVNDGSDNNRDELFIKIKLIEGCVVLNHKKNKGKGAALKTAFGYYLKTNIDHLGVVTLDDDGQHDIEDIKRITNLLKEHQTSLILGSRDFKQKDVPFKSKLGNRVTSLLFHWVIKIKIGDTQTGLRVIPNQLLDTFILVNGNRFEYETNMLLECKRSSIEIIEEKIKTIYIENNQGSHFNPWKDSIRIYKLLFHFAFTYEKQRSKAATYLFRTISTCFRVLLVFLLLAWGTLAIVSYGPSSAARDMFVTSVMETSGLKFLASVYFSDNEIKQIIDNNSVVDTNEISDGSIVAVNSNDINKITVEDVVGGTFIGKMMIVNDPSRLFVEDVKVYDKNGQGDLLSDMIERTGAVAGINGGGFYDPGGYGKGGMPTGVVIKKGVLKNDSDNSCVIGFDKSHKLIVGNMSGKAAINLGIQEAVSFGPALIVNGENVPVLGSGGGLNPRTAIGQRSDGAVLLLVVDGRQPNSLGASYKDIAEIMQQYGAVNAANLDGGSSSMLRYNGEMLNQISMVGVRRIPTAFLVR